MFSSLSTECSFHRSLNVQFIVHWMFTECSLNVHWMFTECSLHHSLNVHWMFTECSRNVQGMSTECSRNVHGMFTECSRNVHWMFTECSLNVRSIVHWMFTSLSTECSFHRSLNVHFIVHWMFTKCSLNMSRRPWSTTPCFKRRASLAISTWSRGSQAGASHAHGSAGINANRPNHSWYHFC